MAIHLTLDLPAPGVQPRPHCQARGRTEVTFDLERATCLRCRKHLHSTSFISALIELGTPATIALARAIFTRSEDDHGSVLTRSYANAAHYEAQGAAIREQAQHLEQALAKLDIVLCTRCKRSVRRDGPTWIDNATGGDACDWNGGNAPHEVP